jgi:hypothetical protein
MSPKYLQFFLTALLACLSNPVSASDTAYSDFSSVLEPGELAAVPTGCRSTNCLLNLNVTNSLPAGSYRLVYLTAQSQVRNSLIVLRRKYVAENLSEVTTRALVRREKIPFACKQSDPGPVPNTDESKEDAVGRFADLNYQEYDRTMRDSYGNSTDAQFLGRHFHVLYDNGLDRECVSTRDPQRRKWFLFERNDEIQFPFFELLARIIGRGSALAEGARGYAGVRINVYPYEKQPGEGHCMSFPIDSSYPAVDIALFDVEDLVRRSSELAGRPRVERHVEFAAKRAAP